MNPAYTPIHQDHCPFPHFPHLLSGLLATSHPYPIMSIPTTFIWVVLLPQLNSRQCLNSPSLKLPTKNLITTVESPTKFQIRPYLLVNYDLSISIFPIPSIHYNGSYIFSRKLCTEIFIGKWFFAHLIHFIQLSRVVFTRLLNNLYKASNKI